MGTKTLEDIKADMSDLYDQVKAGQTEIKSASELANIAGKYLKAYSLDLAERMFMSQLSQKTIPAIEHHKEKIAEH